MSVSAEFMNVANFANQWASEAPLVTPAAPSPGILGSFFQPFVDTLKSFNTSAPTLANTLGQSLNTILLQKAGLIPKPQQQGSGTLVNYDKGQAGNAPPTTINIQQPASGGTGITQVLPAAGGSAIPWGPIALIAGGLLIVTFLFGGSRQPALVIAK